ncbi:MAG: C13 family peptidase [Pseudomonadota bacterium]|nr:C13 family peptidase [Pseudomonadota bacterium]
MENSHFTSLVRLWTLRRIDSMPLRGTIALVACLMLFSMLLWVAIDRWEALPDPQFLSSGIPLFAWYALAIIALASLMRWLSRPLLSFESGLLLVMGLVPVLLVLAAALPYLTIDWAWAAALAAIGYSIAYLVRGLHAFTGESRPAAAAAGVIFIAAFIWGTDALNVIPDVFAARASEATAADSDNQADAESLLFEQPARIDRALAAIPADASARPKAFFLGFAGVGEQKVFSQEIGLASRVLSERYAMHGRELLLVNDERDLESLPLASVTGLRYALQRLATQMNVDRDVLFLSLSSHGAQDAIIAVSNAQLPLNDLTEAALSEALHDSGIKWSVIIISACYAGGFIDSLKTPRTIIIAAAAADRTSFGCSSDRDLTYFGEAFYRDALPGTGSLRDAFEMAKGAIAVRERHEHVESSKPQAYFGSELETKLASMNSGAG